MEEQEILQIWRDLPSNYKQFDELILEFARRHKEKVLADLSQSSALEVLAEATENGKFDSFDRAGQ